MEVTQIKGGGEPLHQHTDGTWWFWNETWADEIGPFETKEEATAVLTAYCAEVLGC